MGKIKNPLGEIFGYCRVSTVEQKLDRQWDALIEYGVEDFRIFMDKQSGKNFNRPAYKKLLRVVRKGDIIVIKSIDRLGRNYQEIIEQWRMITQDIGCGIHVIDMPILNTSGDPSDLLNQFITDMMLQVLSFVAQNERENTINRQKEGIEAAKRRRKVKIGRPKKRVPFDFWEIYIMWKTKEYKSNDLWKYCHETWGTSNRTFYRRINELDCRFGDIPVNRLRDLILDNDFLEGIEFDNERLETGIGYYNQYVLHNPEKARANREKRHEMIESGEIDLDEEERHMKQEMLNKRQRDFRKQFNIPDPEEELPTDLGYKKSNGGSYAKLVNKHNKHSGIEQAVILEDDAPIIPDFDERESQKPMKTIIVI